MIKQIPSKFTVSQKKLKNIYRNTEISSTQQSTIHNVSNPTIITNNGNKQETMTHNEEIREHEGLWTWSFRKGKMGWSYKILNISSHTLFKFDGNYKTTDQSSPMNCKHKKHEEN